MLRVKYEKLSVGLAEKITVFFSKAALEGDELFALNQTWTLDTNLVMSGLP